MQLFFFLTIVVLVLLRRPDMALVVYVVHWMICKVIRQPTFFEQFESLFKNERKTGGG